MNLKNIKVAFDHVDVDIFGEDLENLGSGRRLSKENLLGNALAIKATPHPLLNGCAQYASVVIVLEPHYCSYSLLIVLQA